MENFEKKYKEALRKATKIYRDDNEEIKHYMEVLFPELQDEDEKIRKELVAFLEELSKLGKDTNFDRWKTSDCANWIAWLEKQGKISTKSVHIADIPFGAKDSELQEESYYIPDGCYAYIDGDKVIIKRHNDEKVNSANKIKPKFHKGDWIIDKESKEVFYISKNLANTYEIVDIEGNDYHVPHYILEEDYDVWTIQDAKPGDVLYHISDNSIEYIVMTKGINRCNNVDSYFRYNSIDGFAIDIPSVLSAKDDSITPADKKQRDFLFQKMKEAGYEWSYKDRKLIKIVK